jgi:3-(3-hydroxy-phenyl)propionate hydroxylase
VISERDPAAASARHAALNESAGGDIKNEPRQDIIPGLEEGLLAPVGASGTGTLFPQPRLHGPDGSVLLDDLVGTGWRVVTTLKAEELPPALQRMVEDFGTLVCLAPAAGQMVSAQRFVQAEELEGVVARWFERHGCRAALVRPDHYVYGVADSPEALFDLIAALRYGLAA